MKKKPAKKKPNALSADNTIARLKLINILDNVKKSVLAAHEENQFVRYNQEHEYYDMSNHWQFEPMAAQITFSFTVSCPIKKERSGNAKPIHP